MDGASFQVFRRTPTPEDWARFIPYARRVRSLEFRKYPSRLLADSVFDDLARTRTTLEVLPNLRRLWWDVPPYLIPDPRNAVVFMHNKVTEFSFDADYDNDELHSLATDIVGRMPFLISLKCKRSYASHDPTFDQELLQLLSSLQRLQEVTLPKNVLDGQFLKTLSELPELGVVQFDTMGGLPCLVTPTIGSAPEEGAFPMLYDLCLDSTLDDICHYLTGGVLLPRLKKLSVESVHPESPPTVQRFLVDVTNCYPALEVISMDVIVDIEKQEVCEPLSLEHLQPVLSLKQLTRLELRHNLPLQISEDDLAEFGAALPAIESLVLNPEPLLLTRPGFALGSLRSFAQNFPNLTHLGIYLDAEHVTTHMPLSPTKSKSRLFPNLRTLNVGVSPIGRDHVPVSLFMSHLFSEKCERVVIQSGVSWDRELFEISNEYSVAVKFRCRKWGEVAKALPLLLQLRNEEKGNRQDIEKEVEDLRMRNEVLMGKMRLNEGAKSAKEAQDSGCVIF
jgi:hypothetical protein